MKKIILITIATILLSFVMKGQDKKPKTRQKTFVITKVDTIHKTVIARFYWQKWKAKNCMTERYFVGMKTLGVPAIKNDTCGCIFKRVK